MKTTISALLLTLALGAGVPATATAVVPPKDCKFIKAKGKKHRIKADGVNCRFAKRSAKRYLRSGSEPKGWSCKRYPKSSGFSFRCEKGARKNIYGIKQ